jgi:hypothetical protein
LWKKRRKQWFALDLTTTLQPQSMRKLIIHVLMEVGYSLESKETPRPLIQSVRNMPALYGTQLKGNILILLEKDITFVLPELSFIWLAAHKV